MMCSEGMQSSAMGYGKFREAVIVELRKNRMWKLKMDTAALGTIHMAATIERRDCACGRKESSNSEKFSIFAAILAFGGLPKVQRPTRVSSVQRERA